MSSASSKTGSLNFATASRTKSHETNHIALVRKIPVGISGSHELPPAERPGTPSGGFLEEGNFRKVKGYRDLPKLVASLENLRPRPPAAESRAA